MKVTFKKVDDFTWEFEHESTIAEIKLTYFGLGQSYKLYIDERYKGSFDKLSEARSYGKELVESRYASIERA